MRVIYLLTWKYNLINPEQLAMHVSIVHNYKGYRLSRTRGNANWADLWFEIMDKSFDDKNDGTYQYMALLNDEVAVDKKVIENGQKIENVLDSFWRLPEAKFIKLVWIGGFDLNGPPVSKLLDSAKGEWLEYKTFHSIDESGIVLVFLYSSEEKMNKGIHDLFQGNKANKEWKWKIVSGLIDIVSEKPVITLMKNSLRMSQFAKVDEYYDPVLRWIRKEKTKCVDDIKKYRILRNKRWQSYKYDLFQLLNYFEVVNSEKSQELMAAIMPSVRLFCEQLESGRELLIEKENITNESETFPKEYCQIHERINKSIDLFVDCLKNIINQNSKNFATLFGNCTFNDFSFEIPGWLCLLYQSALYKTTQILNDEDLDVEIDDNTRRNHYQYQFLLTPSTSAIPITEAFEFGLAPEDRLIGVHIAKHAFFSPRAMFVILLHEAGHYIGSQCRCRSIRALAAYSIASYMISEAIIPKELVDNIIASSKLSQVETDYFRIHTNRCKERIFEYANQRLELIIEDFQIGRAHKYHFEDLKNDIYNCVYQEIMFDKAHTIEGIINEVVPPPDGCDKIKIVECMVQLNRKCMSNMYGEVLERSIVRDVDKILNVWKEAYSDLCAILVLQLGPEDYLEAFYLSEGFDIDDRYDSSSIILRIRLISSLCSVLEWEKRSNWEGYWNGEETEDINYRLFRSRVNDLKGIVEKWEYNHINTALRYNQYDYVENESYNYDYDDCDEDVIYARKYTLIGLIYLEQTFEKLLESINEPDREESLVCLRKVFSHFKCYDINQETTYKSLFCDAFRMIDDYKNYILKYFNNDKF